MKISTDDLKGIDYIMHKYNEDDGVLGFSIENSKETKELSIYEIDKELKKYVFSPDSITGVGPENEGI